MNKYNDLELSILSCLLQKPNLMKNVSIDDKLFIKHKSMWIFMKSFYKKFGNFDLVLMFSVCKNKYHLMEHILALIEIEPTPSRINEYIKQLTEQNLELKKERYIIDKIYELSNNLYVKNITIKEFKIKCEEIYDQAEQIFKNN